MLSVKQLTAASLACLVAITLPATSDAVDLWVPVVSKIRRTVTKIPPKGSPEVVQLWEGTFVRKHNGSRLQRLERIQPRGITPVGRFVDRPGGKAYNLNYRSRTAVLTSDRVPGRDNKVLTRQRLESLGRQKEVFRGVDCFVIPVQAAVPSVGGRGCYSPEYDLHLYREIDLTDSTGTTIRHRDEYYDLEIGRAPPEGAVRLPDRFVVQETLCKACASPSQSRP